MQRELQSGDIIEVKEIHLDGIFVREVWKLAQIIEIDTHRIGVRFVRDSTKKLLMLPRDQFGHMWR